MGMFNVNHVRKMHHHSHTILVKFRYYFDSFMASAPSSENRNGHLVYGKCLQFRKFVYKRIPSTAFKIYTRFVRRSKLLRISLSV